MGRYRAMEFAIAKMARFLAKESGKKTPDKKQTEPMLI